VRASLAATAQILNTPEALPIVLDARGAPRLRVRAIAATAVPF
jgi:hypothetical protein